MNGERYDTCGTCRFASPGIADDGDPLMQCRRNPPQVFPLDGEPAQTWPTMAADDWCGDWGGEEVR